MRIVRHVPFEALWSMRVPVPYSQFLRVGDLGWSGGQCPLDRAGAVVAPDDGPAQADLVARHCGAVLRGAGMDEGDICLAVIYHDLPDPAAALAVLRAAFGPVALLLPVAVPAFYYAGMRIEVDLFAATGGPTPLGEATVRGGGLHYHIGPGPAPGVPVIDHAAAPAPMPGLAPHAIIDPALPAPLRWMVTAAGEPLFRTQHLGGADVRIRSAEQVLGLTATAPGLPGLVPQTEAVMEALAMALAAEGLGFGDVVKSTTHYCGAPTPQDLHDNMVVRNRRYAVPGPGSTGIRVSRLAEPGALTAVSLLALR